MFVPAPGWSPRVPSALSQDAPVRSRQLWFSLGGRRSNPLPYRGTLGRPSLMSLFTGTQVPRTSLTFPLPHRSGFHPHCATISLSQSQFLSPECGPAASQCCVHARLPPQLPPLCYLLFPILGVCFSRPHRLLCLSDLHGLLRVLSLHSSSWCQYNNANAKQ